MDDKRTQRDGEARGPVPRGLLRRGEPGSEEAGEAGAAAEARRREEMERAALELSGEVGFERMTVAALVERSGSNLDRFYRTYGDKAGCFAAAYARAIEELVGGVLGACATEPRWADGMRAALGWLAALVEAEPILVKGLLGESRAAQGQTAAKRQEVFERLSRAIDRARRETREPRHSPPPLTAWFILGAIETSMLRCLDHAPGTDFAERWLPGALYVAVDLYLGAGAAREQVRLLAEPGV
jgi:AcrR family transcriptional regulator